MTTINVSTEGAIEPTVIAAGNEAELRIIDVKVDNDKNGNPYMLVRFEVVGEAAAKEFTKFFGIPGDHMDAKRKNNALFGLQTFEQAFGFKLPCNTDDMLGLTGWAILGVDDDEQYGEQNYVKKFIKGR